MNILNRYKMKSILVLLTTMISTTAMAQQIIKCDSVKSYWIINKNQTAYAAQINGKCRTTEKPNLIIVKSYPLQSLLVDKKDYIKEDKDSSDLKVLVTYVVSESEYLSEQFQTKLNIQMQKAPVANEKDVLIWYFEMPSGTNAQVKYQIYANMIINEHIIGIASPVFANQKLETVRDLLTDTISSVRKITNTNKLCTN